jgi:CBS domain containing-hemolysin-like protein
MDIFLDPTIWVGLMTLVLLELVLGIDNLVFIAILAQRLPASQREKAVKIGLALALGMRFVLLACISWLASLTEPLFDILEKSFSGRDLIMLSGGLFLLYKATGEIHGRLEGRGHGEKKSAIKAGFGVVVTQIIVLDAVFSLDAVITAIGMSDHLPVMMAAVTIAIFLMVIVSQPLTKFVNEHPTVVMLCLGFLLMVGFSLIAEGFGFHIPKGYLYAAIGFSVLIEFFNQFAQARLKKRFSEPSDLRERTADMVLRVLGARDADENQSSHEIGVLLHQASKEDLLTDTEKNLLRGVLNLSHRPINTIMTPRTDIEWLDIGENDEGIKNQIVETSRSQLLVGKDDIDSALGIIHREDFLPSLVKYKTMPIVSKIMQEPLFIHENTSVLKSLEIFKNNRADMGVIIDEFGGVQGIVTHHDLLEAIAGEFPESDDEKLELEISHQEDGSYIVDAKASIYDVQNQTGLEYEPSGHFATMAGFILHEFARIPKLDEKLEWNHWGMRILKMDGRRIGKILLYKKDMDDVL